MKIIKCIFNIIIIFLLIISCSSSNKDNKEYKEVISTNSYKITNRIQIARVHFDFNKFNLTRDFIENAILLDLRTNTNILKLYIYGHTDNKGKDWWNYRLGLHRALTVSNIISTNYTSENIILKSFSYSNSIADNRTENGRYSNRRADIFIDLVEETFEIQTNLIKVDSKNEFNILSRFNIDLKIFLIIILLFILIILVIIIIKCIFIPIIISVIKCFNLSGIELIKSRSFCGKIISNIFNKVKNTDTSIIKRFIKINGLKLGKFNYGKIILKIVYNIICKTFKFFIKRLENRKNRKGLLCLILVRNKDGNFDINNHIKGSITETLAKLKIIIENSKIIGNGIDDYKSGINGLDIVSENEEGKLDVIETKYGTSPLRKTKDGKQGSPEYIASRIEDYLNSYNKESEEYEKYYNLLKDSKYSSKVYRADKLNPCEIKSKKLF